MKKVKNDEISVVDENKNTENEVMIFNFEGHDVRGINIDGEPWFVGKDVAEALGYKDTPSSLRKIDNEDKIMTGGQNTHPCIKYVFLDSKGRRIYPLIINESGLYTLILGSQLESAKRFKKWVTKDVLPSIRKTGGYIYGQENMSDELLMSRALIVANNRLLELQEQNDELIEENIEKSSFIELMSGLKDRYLTTEIAYYYGMSAMRFNKLLNEYHIQNRVGNIWELTPQYRDMDFMIKSVKNIWENKEIVDKRCFNAWTKKGVQFIYRILKDHGILPIMEQEMVAKKDDVKC